MGYRRVLSLFLRISSRLRRQWRSLSEQLKVTFSASYPSRHTYGHLAIRFGFLDAVCLDEIQSVFPEHRALVRHQAAQAVAHCFDLLGSGPVVVTHGVKCPGLEGVLYSLGVVVKLDSDGKWLEKRINRANLPESKRIWSLVQPGYTPIDWQLDFKSGYRWQEKCWYRCIRIGKPRGADIKLPWELARLQHLPVLALAAHYAHADKLDFFDPLVYVHEVRNQLLDFIATNPPGFGVNWVCAMDVGIRVANMLLAWDIIHATQVDLDEEFESIFIDSIRSHGRFLASNLEWSPQYRGNHYLADIVGLLFCAVYLPCCPETDVWLGFVTEELLTEIKRQFHPDGSNFEASVCYHRLSAEIVLWGLALLDNLPADKCDALSLSRLWTGPMPASRIIAPAELYQKAAGRRTPVPYWCRTLVANMAVFTRAMTRPDGLVVQFGDNDSGRFVLLGSSEQAIAGNNPAHLAWSLDHRAWLSAACAFLSGIVEDAGAVLIREVAGRVPADPSWKVEQAFPLFIGDDSLWHSVLQSWHSAPDISRWRSHFAAPGNLRDELSLQSFPGMGCYVYRSTRLFLAIRCGEIGLLGLGAHAHCDQLGIELVIDNIDRVRDPGTYLYTPIPAIRNQYRSARAHHVPRSGEREPANLDQGAFDLRGAAEGECLYFGPQGFIGRHFGYGAWIYRIVCIENDGVVVFDFSPDGLTVSDPLPEPLPLSQGYGHVVSTF